MESVLEVCTERMDVAAGEMEGLRARIARTWGIHRLRPLQEEAIRAILGGRDLLLVLPTGGGKSLCYQAPALVREGLTVVVSPLISLMKDQVDGLRQNGVPAGMLASSQRPEERREVLAQLEARRLKLVFVAPERLMIDGFLQRLLDLGLSAVAIDEAHCISHWGHDFRPEYRQLGLLRRRAPHVPLHAFTATATERVRRDVLRELGCEDPVVLVGPCDRPNLTYRVQQRGEALAQVLEVVRRHEGRAGIVYCMSRRETERLSDELRREGVRCAPYHAGLQPEARKEAQERFLGEEIDVVVATVAFGMGIDRTDVRFVVHASLPKGIEQYCQETGRAGRDGLAAECLLLYAGVDFHGWKSLLERSHTEASAGREADGEVLQGSLERLGQMMSYTTRFVCRHRQLVEYFGQRWEAPEGEEGCGACDVCLGELTVRGDSQVLAQKILSAVVRCDQRYGAAHVTAVLRGANSAALRQAGHDRLSTYGIMAEHSMAEVRAWIDQLLGLEHLRVTDDRYPTLFLTRSGLEVMRGEREVQLFALPGRRAARERARRRSVVELDPGDPPMDEGLFQELRELRREIARERAVPPYLVFNDRTLAQLASRKPRTPAAFLEVRGVGEKKAEDLGPPFLERIARWEEGRAAASASPTDSR